MIITTDKVMRPREPHDFYPTPIELCRQALWGIPGTPSFATVLDPGFGTGVWGQAVREQVPSATIFGVDVRELPKPEGYYKVIQADFVQDDPGTARYQLICGNPPYKHAEAFIRRSLNLLSYEGNLVFLLRLAFLEGQARMEGLWNEFPPWKVAVCGARPSFTGNGKTDATAYAVYYWTKERTTHPPYITWLNWKPKRERTRRKKSLQGIPSAAF